ncbi:MoaD/ThiS family protein [Sinomonas sp. ASV322]|uniref:MoaD/ThiS family protein n=1 Tax=Sinomonas sp. ASV322 TaxID=3041920 RepID=UPI0027DCC289|nr:MoaD/ThiS family protein [Sinomonas sp. ASV322]MDQ4504496.1 MoaD/ThiS family protein [Sinomonas sp. ASV322]
MAANVSVVLPQILADVAGGRTEFSLTGVDSVRAVLDSLAGPYPILARRLRDETGRLRRYVNVYVDGEDVRRREGLDTAVADGQEVIVIQSVAGG